MHDGLGRLACRGLFIFRASGCEWWDGWKAGEALGTQDVVPSSPVRLAAGGGLKCRGHRPPLRFSQPSGECAAALWERHLAVQQRLGSDAFSVCLHGVQHELRPLNLVPVNLRTCRLNAPQPPHLAVAALVDCQVGAAE